MKVQGIPKIWSHHYTDFLLFVAIPPITVLNFYPLKKIETEMSLNAILEMNADAVI